MNLPIKIRTTKIGKYFAKIKDIPPTHPACNMPLRPKITQTTVKLSVSPIIENDIADISDVISKKFRIFILSIKMPKTICANA